MPPGLIAGAGPTPHAVHSAQIEVAAMTSIQPGERVEATAPRTLKAPEPRFPVLRGILFALPVSLLLWAGILFLSLG